MGHRGTLLAYNDRMASKPAGEASNYMQELTRYLSNIMSSVLLALPTEIKEFIYFDALSHASSAILVNITFICQSTELTRM
jgi:hypothetical protein